METKKQTNQHPQLLNRPSFAAVLMGGKAESSPRAQKKLFENIAEDEQTGAGVKIKVPSSYRGKPAIQFSDEDISYMSAPYKFAMVGKFSRKFPDFKSIKPALMKFGFKGHFTVGALRVGFVLINFECEEDFTRLWLKPEWMVAGWPMRVFRWTPQFCYTAESTLAAVWVSFPDLPIHFFHKSALLQAEKKAGNDIHRDGRQRGEGTSKSKSLPGEKKNTEKENINSVQKGEQQDRSIQTEKQDQLTSRGLRIAGAQKIDDTQARVLTTDGLHSEDEKRKRLERERDIISQEVDIEKEKIQMGSIGNREPALESEEADLSITFVTPRTFRRRQALQENKMTFADGSKELNKSLMEELIQLENDEQELRDRLEDAAIRASHTRSRSMSNSSNDSEFSLGIQKAPSDPQPSKIMRGSTTSSFARTNSESNLNGI